MAADGGVRFQRGGARRAHRFFHGDDSDPIQLSLGDLGAASVGDAILTRGDARVRFLDPARDYQIGSARARRLDRAEGGVETIEAPLA